MSKKIFLSKTATTKTYIEKKYLNIPLTQDELLEKGDQAAAISEEIGRIEIEKKQEMASYTRIIKSQQERLSFVLETVKKKYEHKEVESEAIYDYEAKKIFYTFEGEVLAERSMGEEELQFSLFEDVPDHQFKELMKKDEETKKAAIKARLESKEEAQKIYDDAMEKFDNQTKEILDDGKGHTNCNSTDDYPTSIDPNIEVEEGSTVATLEIKKKDKSNKK